MGPCFHSRILCFRTFPKESNRFEGTEPQDERSLGKNVQRNLANPRTVKIRNAVTEVINERPRNIAAPEIDCSQRCEGGMIVEWQTLRITPDQNLTLFRI
jgi:hypothetical protein